MSVVSSAVYISKVIEILDSSAALWKTSVGIAKHAGYAAAGCAVGGVVGGPGGALTGSIVGSVYGYARSSNYDDLLTVLRNLSEAEKYRLQMRIQELVGSVGVEELVSWATSEAHRLMLLDVVKSQCPGAA